MTIANIPDVSKGNRDIPKGKTLLCEYGALPAGEPRQRCEVLETKTGWGRHTVRLEAMFAGWAIAGSVLRWDNGRYAVRWEVDGATFGQRYLTFDAALEHFNRIPETLNG